MPPYSDGNLTAWKDRRRIVLSHSTKYGKKSFLGLKKAPQWISRALLSSLQLPVGPAVHMLMSQSLIVSSYFNLLHGVGGEGRRGDDGGGGQIGEVWVRGRDETRGKAMVDRGKEERAEAVDSWGSERRRRKRKTSRGSYVGGGEKAKCLTGTVRRWGDERGQGDIINMQGGDNMIKRDIGTAGL